MNDFDDLSDLDEVLGPLRSSATPAELSVEAAMLDRMVNARRTTEEKHMFTSRRARVATLVAAGVLGFGGMAAASPSLLGDQPVEQEPIVEVEPVVDDTVEPIDEVEVVDPEPVDEVEPIEVLEPRPVEEAEPIPPAESGQVEPADPEPADLEPADVEPAEVLLVNDPATVFDETTCLPGNHGATVSAVARGEFPGDVSVTDAAQSSCGKTVEIDLDVAEIAPEPESEPEAEAEAESEPEAAQERPGRDEGAASNGKENGSSNDKSNGKSNGRSNGNGAPGKRGG